MKKTPFKQQIDGSLYLQERGSGFLFMMMRTGKTLTAILGFLLGWKSLDAYPILILGPITVLAGWISELVDFGVPRESIQRVSGSWQQRRNQLRRTDKKIFLLNYDVAADLDVLNIRREAPYGLSNWGTILFDESYCLSINKPTKVWRKKDLDKIRYPYKISARTHYFLPEVSGPIPSYQRRAALSGLPAPESCMNLASQFLIVDGVFMGYTTFVSYLEDNWTYNKWEHQWEMNHPYHTIRVQEYVDANCFKMTMEQCNKAFGGLQHAVWEIPATPEQRALLERLDGMTTYQYPDDPTVMLMTGGVKFIFGGEVCAGVHPLSKELIPSKKGEYLVAWYQLLKQPAVVVSRSQRALAPLRDYLRTNGIRCDVVDGDTSEDDRERMRQEFQNGDLDMLLGQSRVIMMGYDLSRADYIFHLSSTVEENVRGQVNYRGCRLDKTRPVTIIDMCIEGTKEQELVDIMQNKYSLAHSWISEQKTFLN